MVLSAKVFEIKQPTTLDEIAEKLKDFRLVENEKIGDKEFELITTVSDLDMKGNMLYGTFSRDKVVYINQRGTLTPVLKTIQATIFFLTRNGKTYLTVVQNKHFANYVASLLSYQLFLNYRAVVEARIPPENLPAVPRGKPRGDKSHLLRQPRLPRCGQGGVVR
jgi:hypothetical protein